MANLPILFPSEHAANALVAGVPCAARVLYRLRQSGTFAERDHCVLVVPGGWQPSPLALAECARLAPGLEIASGDLCELAADSVVDALEVLACEGEAGSSPVEEVIRRSAFGSEGQTRKALSAASSALVAATGKPTDGIVSRTINRPVSQFLSRLLLRFAWVRPIHATIAAALIGVAMALSLLFGGEIGLYAGAVLFQLASMIDGVDGEIARATHRSSKLGATLDTASDAATNFAFVAGVAFNLWQQGEWLGAQAGAMGLGCLVVGLSILGARSLAAGGPLSFDALKHEARARSSTVLQFIGSIASRDVYALVLALLILVGLATAAMVGFAVATGLWLAVVLLSLVAKR